MVDMRLRSRRVETQWIASTDDATEATDATTSCQDDYQGKYFEWDTIPVITSIPKMFFEYARAWYKLWSWIHIKMGMEMWLYEQYWKAERKTWFTWGVMYGYITPSSLIYRKVIPHRTKIRNARRKRVW